LKIVLISLRIWCEESDHWEKEKKKEEGVEVVDIGLSDG